MFKNSIFCADLSDSQNHIISDHDGYNNKITIHVVTSSNLTWWLLFFQAVHFRTLFHIIIIRLFFHLKAEDEFSLAKKMQEWQPWEPLQNPPPADQWNWP